MSQSSKAVVLQNLWHLGLPDCFFGEELRAPGCREIEGSGKLDGRAVINDTCEIRRLGKSNNIREQNSLEP